MINLKYGRIEVFVGGGSRRNKRCASGRVVVGGDSWNRWRPCKMPGETRSFFLPSRTGAASYYGIDVGEKGRWHKLGGSKINIG